MTKKGRKKIPVLNSDTWNVIKINLLELWLWNLCHNLCHGFFLHGCEETDFFRVPTGSCCFRWVNVTSLHAPPALRKDRTCWGQQHNYLTPASSCQSLLWAHCLRTFWLLLYMLSSMDVVLTPWPCSLSDTKLCSGIFMCYWCVSHKELWQKPLDQTSTHEVYVNTTHILSSAQHWPA